MALLKDKTALITGGSTGIGLATAKRFVEEGAYVFINGRSQAELDAAVKEIGENVTGVQGDGSKPGDRDRLYAAVADSGRRLDVVFANAAVINVARIGEVTQEHLQKALPLFNDGGSIILNSSNPNAKGNDAIGVYAAIKAALRSVARTWESDLRDRKVRVRVIGPGATETPGINTLAGIVPLARYGTAEEVANAALFLAADIPVDSGIDQVARRVEDLSADDPQFAAARPDPAVAAALELPGLRLPQIVQTALEGYADRPALGQRAVEFVKDPKTGRTSLEVLPHFETITYRELRRPRRRGCARLDRRPAKGRRPGLRAGLHQRRLHHHRPGARPDRRGGGSATNERGDHPAAADRVRDRAQRDRGEREPAARRRRVDPERPCAREAGGVRLLPRGRRPARGRGNRPRAVGRHPGDCRDPGRRPRPREGCVFRPAARPCPTTLPTLGTHWPCWSTHPAAPAHPKVRCIRRAMSASCGAGPGQAGSGRAPRRSLSTSRR